MSSPDPKSQQLKSAISVVRGLVMDMVEEAGSGHVGTALSLAPLCQLLWTEFLKFDSSSPEWPDRDRVVLSSGHAVAVVYALLHLTGHDLEVGDLREFRRYGSRTPGHPELGTTPGIDLTTGALGQGFAAAVGMALAEAMLRARFGRELCDHRTYVIAGDGDMQEGLSHEAAALASFWGLDRLACIYNSNNVTLDGAASASMCEDVASRFTAYGWRVRNVDGSRDDLDSLREGLAWATEASGAPSMLIVRTVLGQGAATMAGDHRCHGSPLGTEEVGRTKRLIGIPEDEPFWIPPDILALCRARNRERAALRRDWERRLLDSGADLSGWLASELEWDWKESVAALHDSEEKELLSPRTASQRCLAQISARLPQLVAGAADIASGTGTVVPDTTDYSPQTPLGRRLRFGIREHGMIAAMTGMATHGGLLPVGGTYLAFSDYARPAMRLAGLMGSHMVMCLTHDGFDCAEDGPTHHAAEHLAALRTIPGVRVIRPADAHEVAQAWAVAITSKQPVALVLSREPVPRLSSTMSEGVRFGAFVLETDPDPHLVLIASGVEVHVGGPAAELLRAEGFRVRLVSAPCWELFEEQDLSYRQEVIPDDLPRFIIEAGISFGWAGRAEPTVSLSPNRTSGPAACLRSLNGLTPEAVAKRVSSSMRD